MKEKIKHLILFIILVVIDQGVKLWVRRTLMDKAPLVFIQDVFSLQYHENTGAVWGIMSGKVQLLSIFTCIVFLLIVFLYFKIPQDKKYRPLRLVTVFILAGAVGNLIDRVFLGYVVDFIYFELINFPLFNIADSYLTVSCIVLFLLAVFHYKEDDFAFLDRLFTSKKKASNEEAGSAGADDKSGITSDAEQIDKE
ncbi:signal peptidase II [Anaerotaenia torta]|uniref:signal peptidase II n=1 Tax=Anaerotaenia torta TaxID=433293 RepID=UPI003D1F06C0